LPWLGIYYHLGADLGFVSYPNGAAIDSLALNGFADRFDVFIMDSIQKRRGRL
jgi:hypothetical protein